MRPEDKRWCPPSYRRHDFRGWHGPRHVPRHWFFMKVFTLFFWAYVIWAVISLSTSNGSNPSRLPYYVICTVPVMALVFFLLNRMFRPLRMLMMGVRELSEGNLDFQFDTRGRHGEIHFLAENFNRMASHIKEMIQSKDQLLLDVSHELRSPLTRLKVALEMTPKGKHRDSMIRDIIEMETMLTEILETEHLRSNHGRLRLTTLDLRALAKEILPKYKGRKPGVKIVGKPESLSVTADESRIRTVFQNILENALKYSSHQKKPVEVSLEKGEEGPSVGVQDFGQGIPPEDQEKVFEPFYRVDKSRTKDTGGYGLGLSLCRVIMRAHGGDIFLYSEPGQGTRIVLKFPCERPD